MARRKSVEILWICCGKPASKQQTMLEKWFPYRKLLKEGFLFWDTFKTFNFNNNVRTKIYPFFSFYTENCYDFCVYFLKQKVTFIMENLYCRLSKTEMRFGKDQGPIVDQYELSSVHGDPPSCMFMQTFEITPFVFCWWKVQKNTFSCAIYAIL